MKRIFAVITSVLGGVAFCAVVLVSYYGLVIYLVCARLFKGSMAKNAAPVQSLPASMPSSCHL